ncbi:hypothetical protein V8F20_007714 [Naviculisporaceae sp. PSN 640]
MNQDTGRESGNNSDSNSPPNSTSQPVAHSGRKGSKKVRTGCITCKIRKVKCDEAKPFCIRCTKTGRRCDGYLPSTKRQPRSGSLTGRVHSGAGHHGELHGSLTVFYDWASADEVRSFQFFQHVTAPCLSGDFDGSFWRVLVLQICQTEPAVKHAVLAVSSLHEGMMRGMVPYADMGDRQSFALWQYNKAIGYLLDQMRHVDAKPLVPLLTCVLFVCIEFMQSKDRESLLHLEQGRQILGQLGRKSGNPEIEIIKQHLVPVYTRLSLTSLMIGCDPVAIPMSLKTAVEIPVAFETIDQVRYTLYDFMDECLRFTKKTRHTKVSSVLPSSEEMRAFEDEQDYLLSKHAKFNVAFSLYQSSKAHDAPPGSISLIQIHIHTTYIMLSTALSRREVIFDDHITSFSAIIPLATSFMDALVLPPSGLSAGQAPSAADTRRFSAMFAFEMHVIAPLYFVATKCRHPAVRRSALQLLKRNPARRENLWRANIMASIAEYIMKVEEQHLGIVENPHDRHSRSISPPLVQKPVTFPFSFSPENMWAASMQEVTAYIQSPDASQQDPAAVSLNYEMPVTSNMPATTAATTSAPIPVSATVRSSGGMMTGTISEEVDMSDHFDLSQVPIDPSLLLDPTDVASVHSFSDAHSIASSFDDLAQPTIYVGGGGSSAAPTWPPYSNGPPPMSSAAHTPGIMLEPPTPMDHHPTGPTLVMMPPGPGMHHSPQQQHPLTFSSHQAPPQHHARRISSELPLGYMPSANFVSEGEEDGSSSHSSQHSFRPAAAPTSSSSAFRRAPGPGAQYSTPQYTKSRTEAPYGIPENLRVHVALIENEKEDGGSWVETFRRMDGPDANWTVQKQYVPVAH